MHSSEIKVTLPNPELIVNAIVLLLLRLECGLDSLDIFIFEIRVIYIE